MHETDREEHNATTCDRCDAIRCVSRLEKANFDANRAQQLTDGMKYSEEIQFETEFS